MSRPNEKAGIYADLLATKNRSPLVQKEGESTLSDYKKLGDKDRESITKYYSGRATHDMRHADMNRKSQLNSVFLKSSAIQGATVGESFGDFLKQIQGPQSSLSDYTGVKVQRQKPD